MNWFKKFFSKDASHSLAELTRQQTNQIRKEIDKENEQYAKECYRHFLRKIYSDIDRESNQGKYHVRISLLTMFDRLHFLSDKESYLVNKLYSILEKEKFRVTFTGANRSELFICWE